MDGRLTPELMLHAYGCGVFPMAPDREGEELEWFLPRQRGVILPQAFHIPRSLYKAIRKRDYVIRADHAFQAVMEACAGYGGAREESWINRPIIEVFCELHTMGHAHSVEVYTPQGQLCGGLYGASLGGAFFGESMFSRRRDASKIALAYLVAQLRVGGFSLLDVQFVTSHLSRFGACYLSAEEYQQRLQAAIRQQRLWPDRWEGDILMHEIEVIYHTGKSHTPATGAEHEAH